MGRKVIRLVALLLCLISILTIFPATAFADGETPATTYIGDGGNKTSMGATGGWREWSRYRAGYRVYVVNDEGLRVSNTIDYLFSSPSGIGQWIWGTKVEGMYLGKSPNTIVKLEDVIKTINGFSTNRQYEMTPSLVKRGFTCHT